MSKESFIAVVGSANVDLTTFNDAFPRPGETIFGKKFDLGFGGKGANQAVAARLCGANVGMVAKVGSDLFGPATIKNFESQGIDATYVRIAEGVSSGVAPIFVDASGQNRIIVVKGANDTLSPEDVDAAAPLLRKADAIILQFEIPLRTVYHTVKFAKANGIRCIVNPAPAQPVDYKEVGAADYFIPNESEAEVITGMPVQSIDEAKKCAEFLLRQGMKRVVITLGERGALAAGQDGTHSGLQGPSRRHHRRRRCFHRQLCRVSERRVAGRGSFATRKSLRCSFHNQGRSRRAPVNRLCQSAKIERP